jgi:hypothetical protein
MDGVRQIPHLFLVVRGRDDERANVSFSGCANQEEPDPWFRFVVAKKEEFTFRQKQGMQLDAALANFLYDVRDEAKQKGFYADIGVKHEGKLHMYWVLATPTIAESLKRAIRDLPATAWKGPGLNYAVV